MTEGKLSPEPSQSSACVLKYLTAPHRLKTTSAGLERDNVCNMLPSTLYGVSRVQLFATPQTVAHQAPLSMGFSRQKYWGGLPFPTPGDLSNPGIKPMSLTSPALSGRFFTISATWEAV